MNRQCNRADCVEPAAASLTYDYSQQAAWLLPFGESHPSSYGLCQRHADTLRVPVGWTLHDHRVGTPLQPAQAS